MLLRFVPGFIAVAVLLTGLSSARAGILFDNGPPAAVDNIGRTNTDPYTIYDNFTLSTTSTIDGVTWSEHDTNARRIFYNSTDISIFNGIPSASNEVFHGNFVANRTANNSPEVFGNIGFDSSITGLSLDLAAGTYFIGIHNRFDNNEQSLWDLAKGSSASIPGRYQTNSPPAAGSFFESEDSVFQILGVPEFSPSADPSSVSVPEPSTSGVALILLGLFGLRRTGRGSAAAIPS